MTDYKFTDEEVTKALECCLQNDWNNTKCIECAFYTGCVGCVNELRTLAIDLINRQKEKIERLYKEIGRISKMTVETNVKEMTEEKK